MFVVAYLVCGGALLLLPAKTTTQCHLSLAAAPPTFVRGEGSSIEEPSEDSGSYAYKPFCLRKNSAIEVGVE